MISIEQQQKLFLSISRRLKKPITIYAVGGTAMMFLGIKDSTLDIDLVFENHEDKKIFKDAIESLGYSPMDSVVVYGARKNKPEMFTLGDERFDLFVGEVIDFVFSENMQKRAANIHQFEEKLILKIASPLDIILMKCATDRIKDRDDVRKIIENQTIGDKGINWKIILEEVKNQIKLGKPKAAFELGYFLETLEKEIDLKVPKEITDELWKITKEQIKKMQRRESVMKKTKKESKKEKV